MVTFKQKNNIIEILRNIIDLLQKKNIKILKSQYDQTYETIEEPNPNYPGIMCTKLTGKQTITIIIELEKEQ